MTPSNPARSRGTLSQWLGNKDRSLKALSQVGDQARPQGKASKMNWVQDAGKVNRAPEGLEEGVGRGRGRRQEGEGEEGGG